MKYEMKYDEEGDILSIVVEHKGKISHAEEMGDIIIHIDASGKPLLLEVLNASKIVPLMVQSLAKKTVSAQT
jgi:uncharacterized protein YuzE